MKIQVEVDNQLIRDLIETFITAEPYWGLVRQITPPLREWTPETGTLTVEPYEDPDDFETSTVDYESILFALQEMASERPYDFGQILDETYDWQVSDTFMQYAALGEIIYG